ncbi:MAG: hypothetical protein ACI4R6_04805 [Lachnospiraceae bacterium]
MGNREAVSIFKEVAQAAGDIVFRYDLQTRKFMQYSDKIELSKYGSWLYDFDNAMISAEMIYSEDIDNFRKLMARVKEGDGGNIEGLFRMRVHVSADYRWYCLIACTNYDKGVPTDVVGRITDVHRLMTDENLKGLGSHEDKPDMMEFLDRNTMFDTIVRFEQKHKNDTMVACIVFNLPAYDTIISRLDMEKSREFRINLIRLIRRNFPYGALVGRVDIHRFAVFTAGLNSPADIGEAIAKSRQDIKEYGGRYQEQLGDVKLDIIVGVDLENNCEGIGAIVYGRAQKALDEANKRGLGGVVFFSDKAEKKHTDNADVRVTKDAIVEHALRMMSDESQASSNIFPRIASSVKDLAEKLAAKYGFERASVSLCSEGQYEECGQWKSARIGQIPDGSLLHIRGPKDNIEEKVDFWEPYIVHDVFSYPDSSWYGRMVGATAVRSFIQAGIECSNGLRGIVSFEYYTQPHVWKERELELFDTVKYVADFYARYMDNEQKEV